MKLVTTGELEIGQAPQERLAAALELAFGSLAEAERRGMVDLARHKAGQPGVAAFEARRGGRLIGALYCEVQLGGSAGLWPPQMVEGAAEVEEGFVERGSQLLLEAAFDWLGPQRVKVVQSLLATGSGSDAERLRAAGFTHSADLLYLVSLTNSFPSAPIEADLSFEPVSSRSDEELAQVLEATYEQTLDCPALNGVQDCRDVLAGYRATGSFDPSRWFFVRREGRDIGCLLLADFPEANQWLVVYMGLLPDVRGQGLGIELVRHAQWLCGQAGRSRLVLAVDAANAPAINIYAAAGFIAWDRRSVWLRVLSK